MKNLIRLLSMILVFGISVTCEKDEPDPNMEEMHYPSGKGIIGKAGGVIQLDEIKLTIPPESIIDPISIQIVKRKKFESGNAIYLDSYFSIEPSVQFSKPVKISIDLSGTNAESPVFFQVQADEYLQVHESSFSSSSKILEATLSHFSDWAVQYKSNLTLNTNSTYRYFIKENFNSIYTGQSLGNENTKQVIESIEGAFLQWEKFLIPANIKFVKEEKETFAKIKFIPNMGYDIFDQYHFDPFPGDTELQKPVVSVIRISNGERLIFINNVDQWLTTKQIALGIEGKHSIEQYTLHEIGHILGLKPYHSKDENSVMYHDQINRKPCALTSEDLRMLAESYQFNLNELPYGSAAKIVAASDVHNSVPPLKSVDFIPKIKVVDDNDNPVPGVPVLFISNPLGIVFNPVGRTDNNGMAESGFWITADSEENQTLLATIGKDKTSRFEIETISPDGYYPQQSGTFTDQRDNQDYRWVKIGNQTWMAENLNTGTMLTGKSSNSYNNGIIEKYCYNDLESNCDKYGGLYKWDEIMNYQGSSSLNPSGIRGICPDGWHIPSDEEWNELERFLGMSEYDINLWGLNSRGGDCLIGNLLRSTYGWELRQEYESQGYDSFGFNILPSGERSYVNLGYYEMNRAAYYWTATLHSTQAYYRSFSPDRFNMRSYVYNEIGFSVRCVKD